MIVNGWTLLFHPAMIVQLRNLVAADARARKAQPRNFRANANVKLLSLIHDLVLEVIPADPGLPDYRQGNTLGPAYRHWFRVKFSGRFRLFFRFDSRTRTIVYVWVNDEHTLRQSGGRNDPYEVFRRMLASGNPPDDWSTLVQSSADLPRELLPAAKK